MKSYFNFELIESKQKGKTVYRAKAKPFPSLTEGQLFQSATRLQEMAIWCQTNSCGHRTSYDNFDFKSASDRNIFLLRWS